MPATASSARPAMTAASRTLKGRRRTLAESLAARAPAPRLVRDLVARAPLEQRLGEQRQQREQCEDRRHRERGLELILVVEDLDVERQRVGLAADVSRDDRHG